jgi:hypothetical protein
VKEITGFLRNPSWTPLPTALPGPRRTGHPHYMLKRCEDPGGRFDELELVDCRDMLLLLEALIGAAAFAGFFMSNFGWAERWFFAGGLLLLAAMRDFRSLQEDLHFEMLYRSLTAATQALERSGGDPDSHRVADAIRTVEAKVTRHRGDLHLTGASLMFIKYAFWVAGGWGAAAYLSPYLHLV